MNYHFFINFNQIHLFYKKMQKNKDVHKEYYNLSNLKDISDNNEVFFRRMIELFIKNATSSIIEIKKSYKVVDFEKMSIIAHKIKPSIDLVCNDELKALVRSIELEAKTKSYSQKLKQNIALFSSLLKNIINDLKKLPKT